jgi:hypothetical protein
MLLKLAISGAGVVRFGDIIVYERKVLVETLPIVEALHRCVNGKGFSFGNSQGIARHSAESLWKRCTFDSGR